jgi:hypothetical protein
MSDNYRYPQAGRLIDASVGFTRGIIVENTGFGVYKILVQKFIKHTDPLIPGEWQNTTNTILAQLAFTNINVGVFVPNKVVWCMYVQQTYFIFLATCD